MSSSPGCSRATHDFRGTIVTEPFKPIDVKSLGPKDFERHVSNVMNSYLAATPDQRKTGHRWYETAHRAAVHVARGIDPDSPGAKAQHRARYTPPADAGEVDRASAAIARLSPSSPAGMSWQDTQGRLMNARAAHEVSDMSGEEVAKFSASRERPEGTYAVHHAGGYAVEHAHALLRKETTPEADMLTRPGKKGPVDTRKKIGSFYQNITDPKHSESVTVDGRSHDIAIGQRLPWTSDRGLDTKARYGYFEAVHQEATRRLQRLTDNPGLRGHQVQATSWIADQAGQEYGRGSAATGKGRAQHSKPVGQ